MPSAPPFFAPTTFDDADEALACATAIYDASVQHLQVAVRSFVEGAEGAPADGHVRACYPFVRVRTSTVARADSRLSYGFVSGPGVYETTLTRPDLFARYYREQFRLLLANHGVSLEVGSSTTPMPVHFCFAGNDHIEGTLAPERRLLLHDRFDLPDLGAMDDGIANGTHAALPGEPHPLALFTAPRVDYSLQRLRHYTGTDPGHFQNFVLFTNYQFYIDEFVRLGHEAMARAGADAGGAGARADGYASFVEPGNVVLRPPGVPAQPGDTAGAPPPRLPQMPAYHLTRADGGGITMVNIGVGPSNAKTITDHVAVLRPDTMIMIGHCGGLRNHQRKGDFVLAAGYQRGDHVLDGVLPTDVPVISHHRLNAFLLDALEAAGAQYRIGVVHTTDNRDWEFNQGVTLAAMQASRSVAVDMESATIAANGFRYRIPNATLLCVSDKPLHGSPKLSAGAQEFYETSKRAHLAIALAVLDRVRSEHPEGLPSQDVRAVDEPLFGARGAD